METGEAGWEFSPNRLAETWAVAILSTTSNPDVTFPKMT